jgi:hypothetical protein
MRMMATGRYASFFDQPGQAFTPFGLNQGNDIVAQLFGPEAGRRVAEQAAAWAGIAPEIMKQMLPVTAATLMGGLFRSAATEGLADFFEKLAETLRGKDPQVRDGRQETSTAGMPDPFQLWAGLMGGLGAATPAADTSSRPRANAPPSPFGPWGDMMNAMLAAGQPPAPPPAPEPPPEPVSPANPLQFFGRMFETGIDAQQQHLATLQNIFDTYWGADHKRR